MSQRRQLGNRRAGDRGASVRRRARGPRLGAPRPKGQAAGDLVHQGRREGIPKRSLRGQRFMALTYDSFCVAPLTGRSISATGMMASVFSRGVVLPVGALVKHLPFVKCGRTEVGERCEFDRAV